MPNGEQYVVSVETTLTYSRGKDYNPGRLTQDAEIQQLKENVANIKNQFSLIESQEFRYILSTEYSSTLTGLQYKRQPFLHFKDTLPIMFS
jgi:hypothetical protein